MELLRSKADLRAWAASRDDSPCALVPTMGALHRGHTTLFDVARKRVRSGEGTVVATIFVNPIQFGPSEDLDSYPRTLDADLAQCQEHGVDAVFVPNVAEMYAPDRSVIVSENRLSNRLCGASRPAHFDGVCTVVAKLFLLVQPDLAVFGEKDYQQLAVIRRMVRDLDFPIRIVGVPTVREVDGLALSSRNVYLSPVERTQAPLLHQSLMTTAEGISSGRIKSTEGAKRAFGDAFSAATLARLDYFEVVDAESLEPLDTLSERNPRLITAAFFGKTRLIDNTGID